MANFSKSYNLNAIHSSKMCPRTFLQKMRRWLRPSKGDQSRTPPPPYSTAVTVSDGSEKKTITASDTPQWLWSKSQCQEWLVAVYTTYLQYPPNEAVQLASKFEGFGPNIYLAGKQRWENLLGKDGGSGLFALICCMRYKEDAVPKNAKLVLLEELPVQK